MSHEIFRNSTQYVYLDIYGDTADPGSVSAVANNGTEYGLVVGGPETTVEGAERWTATVGFLQTQEVGELSVKWTFTIDGQPATKTDYFDIVVPLLEVDDMREEVSMLGPVSDAELSRAERKVRNYIETFTGQVFAPQEKTLRVRTEGNRFLLPERLISITETSPTLLDGYELESDGWGLRLVSPIGYDYPGVISAPGYYDVKRDMPYTYNTRYRAARELSITGRWGWNRVPAGVREAALILIEDILSPDGAYRDKYLESLTSPDWRIQFNGQAFSGTGNVRADQLLSPFVVKSKWGIV